MSPKIDREPVAKGFTIERRSSCGKIYSTITVSPSNKPMEVFIRFGKAGGCGSAIADGLARLASYALRSGLDPADAVKALAGNPDLSQNARTGCGYSGRRYDHQTGFPHLYGCHR